MDNVEFPDKYYRLKDVKKHLLDGCSVCCHLGHIDGKLCKCMKIFEKYVDYAYSGIEEEYWNSDFKNFKSDQVALEQVEKYCKNLDNAKKFGLGLILHGNNGTGKTMLSSIILMYARKKYSIYFITFEELLNIIKKSFNNEYYKNYFESKIKNSDFLCLDDLGEEYRPKDVESFCVAQLSALSKYRRRNHLCTVVTTNLDKNSFIITYGKTISSLFSGCSKFIAVNGPDWRDQQNKNWDKHLLSGHD